MKQAKVWEWRDCIIKHGPNNATYKHVLLTLSCFMNKFGGSCFPSIKTLVDVTSLSKPTVIKYLKMAKNDGWLKKEKRGYGGQRWARNEYTALLPKEVKHFYYDSNKAVKQVDQAGKIEDKGQLNSLATNTSCNSTNNSNKVEHALLGFIKKNLNEVKKLDKQLNLQGAKRLTEDFDVELIKDVLLDMENYKGLNKKYNSVFITARNWCKRQNNTTDNSSRPKQQIV